MSDKRIKIIADDKIPFLKGVLEPYADVEYYPGKEITHEIVKDAQAIITRTRTKCNAELLAGSDVRYIATATIGYDHIDTEYCDAHNIKWSNAPGCNSSSVQQYIGSAIITLAEEKNLDINNLTLGVVGVGNVGSKVAKLAETIGMKVLLNDPPRARDEGDENFVDLDTIISECDIITFHVPLNKEGEDKTYHMCDKELFSKFRGNQILINSSRGSVVSNFDLKDAIREGIVSACVLDVWENEPEIDTDLLRLVDIATPHIAGYSADGKANGTAASVNVINKFFNIGMPDDWYPNDVPLPKFPVEHQLDCMGVEKQQILKSLLAATYDIKGDDANLRNNVKNFEALRGSYPIRREYPTHSVYFSNCRTETIKCIKDLGFRIQ